MGFVGFVKLLYDSRLLMIAPGWAALVLLGYVEFFQITGVQDAVKSLQVSQLEERLDSVYAALCMSPGDPGILERVRELQQQYEKVTGNRYEQPDCALLLKLR